MKTFQYNIGSHAISIRLDEKQGTIADFLVDGNHPAIGEEEMKAFAAVIALALIEHDVEIVHDDEPGVITLSPQSSGWADPLRMMNRNNTPV